MRDLLTTVFYRCQKEFFEKGASSFESSRDPIAARQELRVGELEEKLFRKHEVLSEAVEEHIA